MPGVHNIATVIACPTVPPEEGYSSEILWSRTFRVESLPGSVSLQVVRSSGDGEVKTVRTIAEFAIPRSRPSSKVHALHSSLLDMYPHLLHVSGKKGFTTREVATNMKYIRCSF